MKKQLIAIGLVSFLAVPSVVFAEGDACAPIMSEAMTEEAVMAAKSAAMDSSECMGQRLGSIEEFSHGHGVSLYGSFRTGLELLVQAILKLVTSDLVGDSKDRLKSPKD